MTDVLMPVVIYARYSSQNQREESIEGQVAACEAYAEANGMVIVGVYADRALSGRTDRRPEFLRLVSDARRRAFTHVLCWKSDRIARNREDMAIYRRQLRKCGVTIQSVTENIPDGAEGIILEAMLDGLAEYYSANLAENTLRGMRTNAMQGKANGVAAPYGYTVNDADMYVLNPKTAPIAQEIFERYAAGHAMSEIIRWTKEIGAVRDNGKPFTYNNLRFMLQNPKYIGKYKFADIELDNVIPPLVSEQTFETVQQMLLNGRRKRPGRLAGVDFLLSGKAVCGACGSTITGDSGTSRNGSKHYYYTCSNRKNGGGCQLPSFRQEQLENFVIYSAAQVLTNPDTVDAITDAVLEHQSQEPDALKVSSLQERIRQTEREIDGILDLVSRMSTSTDAIAARMTRLEDQRKALNTELQKAKAKRPIVTADMIRFWLKRFKDGDADSPAFREYLIDTLINAVHLYADKTMIIYNHSAEITD